ncbi:hypothetical protein [Halodesulfovibrio aestuarii]|uniref:hypothetical protein n=1 Tax=Halodesulfovibrio aestuarii TaxID=126333 RepID=UPI00040D076B
MNLLRLKKTLWVLIILSIANVGHTETMTPQKLDYRLEIDTNDCAFEITINDFAVFSFYKKGPVYLTMGIGEYLKPQNNKLAISVWPATNETDLFDKGSFCKVTLAARDRTKTAQLSAFSGIHYYPKDSHEYNISEKSIQKISEINTHLGKSIGNTEFKHYKENLYYYLTQQFDIDPNYKVWNWETSPTLASKYGYDAPLPPKQREALFSAYQELWNALNKKDVKKLELLFHEQSLECAEASGTAPERYFKTNVLLDILKDPELSLAPLSFKNVRYYYSLDKKLVNLLDSKTSLIHFYRNNKKDHYVSFYPSYRYDGKKFVISR